MQDIFNYSIFGNTIYTYMVSLGIFIGGIFIVFIFKKYILSLLKKWANSTDTTIDDLFVKAIQKSLIPVFYFGVFYVSIKSLILSPDFEKGINIAATILITFLVVKTIVSAVNLLLQSYFKKAEDTVQRKKQLRGLRGLFTFIIWAIASVFLLDNLGIKITAVVAGLGIGGIAVALAAQAVLGDLFSYFVIFFDKPFEVGAFIIVGEKIGVVENIGIKTTRIRALGGEQLVFSNTDLTSSSVHNYKKMERRRVVFSLGVIYQPLSKKLKTIPQIVKDIIEKQEDAAFDRGHFASYGDFSLNFEFVYYVTGADYKKHMDIQQAINLSIFEAFEKVGIEFAYPSQTLYVNRVNPGK